MRVRRLAAVGTAALLLPFAACSDGESSAEPVEPTSSASPSPSGTASAGPTLPPAAQGDDEAAAKAFVEFYFDVLSDAMQTGKTHELRSFSGPACKTCSNFAALIEDTYAKNGRYQTRGWSVERAIPVAATDDARTFALRTRQHRRRLLDSADNPVDVHKASVTPMRIIVRRDTEHWVVTRLDVIR